MAATNDAVTDLYRLCMHSLYISIPLIVGHSHFCHLSSYMNSFRMSLPITTTINTINTISPT